MVRRGTPAMPERGHSSPDPAPAGGGRGGNSLPDGLAEAALARTLPLYVADPDGSLRYSNALYEELAGTMGWPGARAAVSVAAVLEAEASGDGPVRREHAAAGAPDHILCTSRHEVLRDAAGRLLGILGTFERRQRCADADGATTRQRLSDIVRLATDWIWETDRELRFTYMSPRVTDMLGYHPKELAGQTWAAIAVDGPPLAVDPAAGRIPALDGRGMRLRHRDGSLRQTQISAVPVYDGGTFCGYRGVARDVTDLRSREDALQEAKERAEQADRAKSLFLAQMSHELRTPLNAIIGFSEIIAQETLGEVGVPAYREYAGDVVASAHHLLAIINDVLDVSKIESGTFTLTEDETDADDLMAEARRLVEGEGDGRAVTIRVHPASRPVCLAVDVARMRQILVNLLANAAKYSEAGGTVDLSGELDDDGGFVFRVSDGGPGMSAEQVATALQPFGQVDTSMAREHGGVGLGLPLAERLIAQHGGELVVDSAPGAGTTVAAVVPPQRVVPMDANAGG